MLVDLGGPICSDSWTCCHTGAETPQREVGWLVAKHPNCMLVYLGDRFAQCSNSGTCWHIGAETSQTTQQTKASLKIPAKYLHTGNCPKSKVFCAGISANARGTAPWKWNNHRWETRSSGQTQARAQPRGGVKVCGLLFVGCLTSQLQASVSQGRICSDNFTCCHTEIEVADQTFYLTQSQYTDTGPTSPSADPITPGRVATGAPIFKSLVWLDPEKIPAQAGFEPGIFRSRGRRLTTRPTRRLQRSVDIHYSSSVFPSSISGVHHVGWDFCVCDFLIQPVR